MCVRYIPTRRHFHKALIEKDIAKLRAHLIQRMQRAGISICTEGFEIVRLKRGRLPSAAGQHVDREVSSLLRDLRGILGSFSDGVGETPSSGDQFALLQIAKDLGVGAGLGFANGLEHFAGGVLYGVDQEDEYVTVLLDPFVLERIALAYFRRLGTDFLLHSKNTHTSLN